VLIYKYLKDCDAPRLGRQNEPTAKASFNQLIVMTCRSAQHLPKIHNVLDVNHLAKVVAKLLSAGSDTESNAIIVSAYHVLSKASNLKRSIRSY
jgi:hypothetical protein